MDDGKVKINRIKLFLNDREIKFEVKNMAQENRNNIEFINDEYFQDINKIMEKYNFKDNVFIYRFLLIIFMA